VLCAAQQEDQPMKRIRATVEMTRRTSVEFEVYDDADTDDITAAALDEAELADWDEDPPEVISIDILDDPHPSS
jgi:hypothetical protein